MERVYIATELQLQELISKAVALGIAEKTKTLTPKDYSKKGFAEKIERSISWIDSERRKGKLSFFMRGGEVRIPASELEKYQYQGQEA